MLIKRMCCGSDFAEQPLAKCRLSFQTLKLMLKSPSFRQLNKQVKITTD